MELTKCIFFIVLATLSITNAFNTLTPWDKEVIYNWKAFVKAGTPFPALFGSQFILHGKVHVQSNANVTHVKITDLTYKLYNGKLDHVREHEAHDVPVTQEVQDLQRVFKIIYDSHGHVTGIVTEAEEKEFSRNMKKAIGGIFQVDDSVMKDHTHAHGFVTKEHSIYGYHTVDYSVVPHHDKIVVYKAHDMRNSHHLYQHMHTNTVSLPCNAKFEQPLMHDSQRKYELVKQGDHYVAQNISTHASIYYYPMKAKSNMQVIIVKQNFELVETVPVQEHFKVQSEHQENDLTYNTGTHPDSETLPDVTNDRHVPDHQKLAPVVIELIKEVPHYLHEDHIRPEEPNEKQVQLVNRIVRLLSFCTLGQLEELHKTLTGEDLNVFYHVLPLVGTKSAALFVKKLVVDKVVSDEVAVEMLQHLPEHVIVPSIELLAQMEDLIHLGENVHWTVRRVGIFSFASLIHKSYKLYYHQHMRHQHEKTAEHTDHHRNTDIHELEKPYQKYVTEYINKIKDTEDYKVKMAYTFAMFNMKLHSITQHMIPLFNGEGTHDRTVRFNSLFATAPSILSDPSGETIIETMWPIFMNREELTEMRIIAYYFIMESQPSYTRLKNIFFFMMTEPNDEIYHFHYTYVKSQMETHDPCKEEFRVKMAQLMKFMHPPSHGLSSMHLVDYQDIRYGFSGGMRTGLIKTNTSQIGSISFNSQTANIYHEDYFYLFRIRGIYDNDMSPSNMFVDLMRRKIPMAPAKDVSVEVVVIKQLYVVNTYYFDKDNLHELGSLLDLVSKDSQSVSNNMLHIGYQNYHKLVIPTDLGTPAMWEYLMPSIQQANISVVKTMNNNILNIHVNNRYVNSIHWKHGLSFYNPIADVWQGINRMHTFDTVVPFHFEINVNTQKQSLQISWKKHDNPQMNIIGMRTHVEELVFVRDDYNRNILAQSSPNSKSWQVVTNGKQYRKDYKLVDEDDLNTGHKWYVGLYDSGWRISNGSFKHLMHEYIQPYAKHFESPLEHLIASYANFYHRSLVMPREGIYGVIIRGEPSHEHVVSNIDLSIRVHNEITSDDYYYSPASKWSTRVTYAVKNKEQSLKTWDINALLDMNAGHTINNLKMDVVRIVPGQKDYKICVDGVKKWTGKDVKGHLNIAMSQTPDGKCVKDDTVVDVTMTGQRSYEQDHEPHIYGSCHYVIPYIVPHYHTLQCLASHTSVRHYVYNVKTTNVPTEFKKTLGNWWDQLKGHYMSYYTYQDEHNEDIGEHNLKVDVTYPMQMHLVDVHVTTPQHVYSLTGVPTDYWRSFGVSPDSTVYSPLFQYLHKIGHVDHCIVHHDHHRFNHHNVYEETPAEWTLYVGDAQENPHMGVYVKSVANDKIALKVVCHGHVMEVTPQGNSHQITLDGKEVPDEEQHHEDWVHYHVFTNDVNHPLAVMLPQSGLHFEYNGHQVVVLVPKMEHQLHGHCYGHH